MAEVLPFKGVLYNRDKVAIKDVVAPPYDVISPEEQERLYTRHPYNIVRLILNKNGNDRYTRAREYLHHWLEQGILKWDTLERFYLYRQTFVFSGEKYERWAFLCRVKIEEFSKGVILPHEMTLSAPKEDRLKLMRECKMQFSPVFGLFPDRGGELYRFIKRSTLPEPLFQFTDEKGISHTFWPMRYNERANTISKGLADRTILIADGHHRYETALMYRDECSMSDPEHHPQKPYNFVFMALVSMEDPGLLVLPTHRVISGLDLPTTTLWERARRYFERKGDFTTLSNLLKALENAPHYAFGLYPQGGPFSLLVLKNDIDLDVELAYLAPSLRDLDIVILHSLFIERVLNIAPQEIEKEGRLIYQKDPGQALRDVQEGRGTLALFLKAPSIARIEKVAREGETMPQKSTFFYPKLLTGLVMYPLWD